MPKTNGLLILGTMIIVIMLSATYQYWLDDFRVAPFSLSAYSVFIVYYFLSPQYRYMQDYLSSNDPIFDLLREKPINWRKFIIQYSNKYLISPDIRLKKPKSTKSTNMEEQRDRLN